MGALAQKRPELVRYPHLSAVPQPRLAGRAPILVNEAMTDRDNPAFAKTVYVEQSYKMFIRGQTNG